MSPAYSVSFGIGQTESTDSVLSKEYSRKLPELSGGADTAFDRVFKPSAPVLTGIVFSCNTRNHVLHVLPTYRDPDEQPDTPIDRYQTD